MRCIKLIRSEEHTSELQSLRHLVCRLLLEKKKIRVGSRQTFGSVSPSDSSVTTGPDAESNRDCKFSALTPATLPRTILIEFFFFNDTATAEIYTLSLHGALPI